MTNPLPTSYLMGKTNSVAPRFSNKTGMPAFTSLIQHGTRSLNHNSQTRIRNKSFPNWKGNSKTVFIHRWHGTVHREAQNPPRNY